MFFVTFHHLVVGLVAGIGTLCAVSAIAAYASTYFVGGAKLREHLDRASFIAACACLPLMPIAVLSGTFATGAPGEDAMTYNKFLFSGLTAGFLASMIIGRWRFGPAIWLDSKLGPLQTTCAVGVLGSIFVLGSIGSKITLGESTLDFLPFWPEFATSIAVNQWFGLALFLLSIGCVFSAFKLGPATERLS